MRPMRTIVHATDFSPASRRAFERAVEMAKGNRAQLLLVHVVTPDVPFMMGDGYVSPKVYERMEAAVWAEAQKQLRRREEQAKRAGVRVKGLLLEGMAAERIVQAARGRKADLLVLGTHGRTGLARFFLGSVASRVLALSRGPVLTVRGR